MKCFVIAQENKVKALNVVGVKGIAVEGLDDVRKAVEDAVSDRTIGTLLVSKEVQEKASDILERHRNRAVLPVVMLLDD
ncbi:MAG: hypothetical protein J6X41_01440 [Spirochaetales bacterium]|nr:hypothetical protein [Spirochaetales bacterium]